MIIKSYHKFIINENLQKARSVISRLHISETDPNFIKLRNLLEDNLGYIGKFTEWLFIDRIPIEQLENLYNLIKVNNLPKPIDEFNKPEEIIDLFVRTTAKSDINQMVNAIPSRTREALMETENWIDFIRFLKQNRDKKAIIIDFLSKKSARYMPGNNFNQLELEFDDEDDWDIQGQGQNSIDLLIQDIEQLLDSPTINSIKQDAIELKPKKHIYFIFENNKYLMVCVDYQGIKKYGSRYWCITQSEDTFNNYIKSDKEESNLQLILYDKTKKIYVDDQSVMGITMDALKRVTAAFWEDDKESSTEAKEIIDSINIPIINIYRVYKILFGKQKAAKVFYGNRELYSEILNQLATSDDIFKLQNLFIDYLKSYTNNDLNKFDPSELELESIPKDYFFIDFCKKLKQRNLRINVPFSLYGMIELLDGSQGNIESANIFEISNFNKSWLKSLGIFYKIARTELNTENIKYLINYLSENGYNIPMAIYILNEEDDRNYLVSSIKSRIEATGIFEVNKRGTVRIIKK